MRGRTLISTTMSLSLVGSALIFAPALYLRHRVSADPMGIVDGLLRISWWLPLVFLVALVIYAGGKLDKSRALLSVYLPLLLTLTTVAVLGLGWSNDGTIIVDHPARKLSPDELMRESRGDAVYRESDFSPVAEVAIWAHQNLPRHPFGRAPVSPGALRED